MNHQLTRIASKEGGKKGSSHTMFCIQQNDDVNKRQSQQLLLGGESERTSERAAAASRYNIKRGARATGRLSVASFSSCSSAIHQHTA